MQLQTQLNFEKLTEHYRFQEVYRKSMKKKSQRIIFSGGYGSKKALWRASAVNSSIQADVWR